MDAGWYTGKRYHDGQQWTELFVCGGRHYNEALAMSKRYWIDERMKTLTTVSVVFWRLVMGVFALGSLGIIALHPWLLIVLAAMAGGGGFLFWKARSARDRRDQILKELFRRDVLADRAEYEDKFWREGDPRGTWGRYTSDHDQGES